MQGGGHGEGGFLGGVVMGLVGQAGIGGTGDAGRTVERDRVATVDVLDPLPNALAEGLGVAGKGNVGLGNGRIKGVDEGIEDAGRGGGGGGGRGGSGRSSARLASLAIRQATPCLRPATYWVSK